MTLRLLVVEDSEPDFGLMKRLLHKSDLEADCRRESSMEGLVAALLEGDWNLVIADYNVPGLEFLDTLELVRAYDPAIPVILFSGSLGEERAVEILQNGVSDYVLKDRPQRLPSAIRKAVDAAMAARARQASEKALQESEERFRLAMLGTRDGLWDWEMNKGKLYLSPQWKAMLGYADEEVDNSFESWTALCHPEDLAAALSQIETLANCQQDHFEVEVRMRHKNGSYRDILSRAFVSRDSHGTPARMVGTHIDQTDRKQAERRLAQASIVFDTTHDAIVVTDQDGNIQAMNPAFAAITGFSQDEAVGQNMRILRSGRHDREFYQQMWSAMLQSGQWQGHMWNRRKNGDIYRDWATISAYRGADGSIHGFISIFSDLSAQERAEQLERLAYHDALTGLGNRLLLGSRLDHALERCRRTGKEVAVLFLDLDHFKAVNDNLGHGAGDELLKAVADRLKSCLRASDTLVRFGGDEFVAILEDVQLVAEAEVVADKLITCLRRPFLLAETHAVTIGTSVGITLSSAHCISSAELIRQADTALYQAKASGRNCWQVYLPPPMPPES